MEYAFYAFWGALAIIFLLLGIVTYVLAAVGLYNMAKNKRLENAWLAWIPLIQLYIIGKIIGHLEIGTYDVPRVELVLPGLAIAVVVLGAVPLVGTLVVVTALIVSIMALYRLYTIYRPDQAVFFLVISILIPFMGPVFIFIMRHDMPLA